MKLFVHIPKNGGMTIRRSVELKPQIMLAGRENHVSAAYSDALLARMDKDGEHHGYEHARWRDWRADLRIQYPTFAIVRNPWARTVSRWTFAKFAEQQGKHQFPASYAFSDFLEERHLYGNRKYYWHRAIKGWYQQKDYVTDVLGVLRCDILRLEHLNEDAAEYLSLKEPLPTRNVSNGRQEGMETDYRAYYSEADYKIIADWYAEDIEYFGFTFESAATRNII